MVDATWSPMHGGRPKVGDYVAVLHDCVTEFGTVGWIRHETPVLVTEVAECVAGTRVRGVRCDASRIEWILEVAP